MRGAGFNVGGNLVMCVRLIGTAMSLVGCEPEFDDTGIDCFNTVTLGTVTLDPLRGTTFETLTTLLSAGSGLRVDFDMGFDDKTIF